jgi:hypothetical protein
MFDTDQAPEIREAAEPGDTEEPADPEHADQQCQLEFGERLDPEQVGHHCQDGEDDDPQSSPIRR